MAMDKRLLELDGLRAIAILMVVAFHYGARFPAFYPYGDAMADWTRHGDLGVDLFFIVSGFVIALTLRASDGALSFALRRATRLWPPMVVCSLLTFAVLHAVDTPYALEKRPEISAFIPSWTFTDPKMWRWAFPGVTYVDGVYWTLFVEVRFYVWAAIVFFAVGAARFPALFCAGFLGLAMLRAGAELAGMGKVAFVLDGLFVAEYMHYFCAGILFHERFDGRRPRWQAPALALCALLAALSHRDAPLAIPVSLAFFAAFLLLCEKRSLLRWLRVMPLVWIGWASYSLYLLHEHIGVTIIAELPQGWGLPAYIAAVTAVAGLMLALSLAVFLLIERRSGRWARALLALRRRPAETG